MAQAMITDRGLAKHLGEKICAWKRDKGRSSRREGTLIRNGSNGASFVIDTGEERYFLRRGDRVRIDYGSKKERM